MSLRRALFGLSAISEARPPPNWLQISHYTRRQAGRQEQEERERYRWMDVRCHPSPIRIWYFAAHLHAVYTKKSRYCKECPDKSQRLWLCYDCFHCHCCHWPYVADPADPEWPPVWREVSVQIVRGRSKTVIAVFDTIISNMYLPGWRSDVPVFQWSLHM